MKESMFSLNVLLLQIVSNIMEGFIKKDGILSILLTLMKEARSLIMTSLSIHTTSQRPLTDLSDGLAILITHKILILNKLLNQAPKAQKLMLFRSQLDF